MDQVERRRVASVIVGIVLSLYLAVFFWIFLGELRGQVFPFLTGMAVVGFCTLVAAPTTKPLGAGTLRPDAYIALAGGLVLSMYTVLIAAFVGAVLLDGPRIWIRLITLAAVTSLVLLLPTTKQISAEAGQG